MNYIKQINLFEALAEQRRLPVRAQVVYYKLLAMNNRLNWCEYFFTTNTYMMNKCGFSNENAFIRARQVLIDNGLLLYISGRRGVPSKYTLVPLCKQYVSKSETLQSSDTKVLNTVYETMCEQSCSNNEDNILAKETDIYKQAKQTKKSNSSYPVETVDNVDNFSTKAAKHKDLALFLEYVNKNLYRCPAKKTLLKEHIANEYLQKTDVQTLFKVVDTFIARGGRHITLFDILLSETPPLDSQWHKDIEKLKPKRARDDCTNCKGEGFVIVLDNPDSPQGTAVECGCKYEK